MDALAESLQTAPEQGTALGSGCRKIRVAVASKSKGKSGGARVITLVKQVGTRVILLAVYDKSDRADLAPGELDDLLAAAGLGLGPPPLSALGIAAQRWPTAPVPLRPSARRTRRTSSAR